MFHRLSEIDPKSGPDASAQSVGRVARLGGNVRQPNHVLANEIAGHKAERRPGGLLLRSLSEIDPPVTPAFSHFDFR